MKTITGECLTVLGKSTCINKQGQLNSGRENSGIKKRKWDVLKSLPHGKNRKISKFHRLTLNRRLIYFALTLTLFSTILFQVFFSFHLVYTYESQILNTNVITLCYILMK